MAHGDGVGWLPIWGATGVIDAESASTDVEKSVFRDAVVEKELVDA